MVVTGAGMMPIVESREQNICLDCAASPTKKEALPLMSMGEPLKLKSSPFPGLLGGLGLLKIKKGVVSHLRLHPKNGCCCQGKMSGFNVQRFCQSDSFQTTRAALSSSATCFRRVGVKWSSSIRFNVGPEIPNSLAACLRVIAFCSS